MSQNLPYEHSNISVDLRPFGLSLEVFDGLAAEHYYRVLIPAGDDYDSSCVDLETTAPLAENNEPALRAALECFRKPSLPKA